MPLERGSAVSVRCKFEQHRAKAHSCCRGGGPHSHKSLPHGDNDLGA
jgi:hypothetical protein